MALDVSSAKAKCFKCGKEYSRYKGYFPVNYSALNKGIGHTPYCKNCIDEIYETYLARCGDAKSAVRQVCRKLDLYWNEYVYEVTERKATTRTMMTNYISKINGTTYLGKSYDNTLSEEGALWSFNVPDQSPSNKNIELETTTEPTEDFDVTDEVRAFWGSGYTPDMYQELEERRAYWMSRLPKGTNLDIGTETLIKQACNLEIDINRARAEGKPIDKLVNALGNVLGGANLKPAQKKDDLDASVANTPMGVWLYRYENLRPLPEVDEDLKDVNGIKKYMFTWMGHLCKMLGVKNGYTRLYEEEIARLRVEQPEYDEEDDESLLVDAYSENTDDVGK